MREVLEMLRIFFFFIVLASWPTVQAGPQTNLHANITDQELFWGADQYEFAVVVPAAGLECFWHFAHHGEHFYLTFQVRENVGMATAFSYSCFSSLYIFFIMYISVVLELSSCTPVC